MGKLLDIAQLGNPVLRKITNDINEIDDNIESLSSQMLYTVQNVKGVGLAAPQIGISKRVFVADVGDGPFVMVNPEVVDRVDRGSSMRVAYRYRATTGRSRGLIT